MTHRQAQGLTVLELLIGVAIVAMLLGFGVPSMRDWMIQQRVAAVASELSTDMRYARSEGLSGNVFAVVRAMSGGKGCYVVYRSAAPRVDKCDCLTNICTGTAVALKTVVMPLTGDVSIVPSDPSVEVQYRSGSDFGSDGASRLITVNDGTASRELRLTTVQGTQRPSLCAPSGSKVSGFATC